jgi:fluoroacetyl-CoA thioesterase
LVNSRHLAPTPVGKQVRVRAEITGVDGMKVEFAVAAWDDVEKIGLGTHERHVIEIERFLKRVEGKLSRPS